MSTTDQNGSSTLLASQHQMHNGPITKYQAFPLVPLRDRTWPDQQITRAPLWCSVDLRDGNQALAVPMSVDEKLEMFALLCEVGFKEIEVGFPSASQIEFDFCRRLIDENRVPGDVTLQVLVQAREELIRRSFDALQGAKRAIVHLYNSTNPAQRRIVFNMSREQICEIAVRGATLIRELADARPETEWVLQYSPESFVLTELEFSLQICQAVSQVWEPTPTRKIILNLPTTVESSTPNVHADQIEWFCRHLKNRESSIISLHTHNDRGTGVAATELGLLAGAERVEGTLFGNGERTGNLDIVTVALNLYTQGVEPNLNLRDLPRVREIYERTTRMEVPPRHPYGGDLVFTAFSGSHQDAINKGFKVQSLDPQEKWEVPYLPIDPQDVGRDYQAIIRYNSQSGKGGAAFLLEQFGYSLPKQLQVEFGKKLNAVADALGREMSPEEIRDAFEREYLGRETPLRLEHFRTHEKSHSVECAVRLRVYDGAADNGHAAAQVQEKSLRASGNGPINAFVVALRDAGYLFDVASYAEHSLGTGANAQAVAYVCIERDGTSVWGAATDTSIEMAGVKAVVSALNRALSV